MLKFCSAEQGSLARELESAFGFCRWPGCTNIVGDRLTRANGYGIINYAALFIFSALAECLVFAFAITATPSRSSATLTVPWSFYHVRWKRSCWVECSMWAGSWYGGWNNKTISVDGERIMLDVWSGKRSHYLWVSITHHSTCLIRFFNFNNFNPSVSL